jgi:hypothetical protein
MFDLSVKAVDNTLAIQVVDSMGNTINYPLITDATDPLLTGTVGLSTWGTDTVYYMGYSGQRIPTLLTAIPEPSTVALGMAAAFGCLAAGRRRR